MRFKEFRVLTEAAGYRPEKLELMPFDASSAEKDPGAVQDLQRALISLGYNVGPTRDDGIFGPNTQSAIRAFQHKNNLRIDGQPGEQTISAIAKQIQSLPPAPAASLGGKSFKQASADAIAAKNADQSDAETKRLLGKKPVGKSSSIPSDKKTAEPAKPKKGTNITGYSINGIPMTIGVPAPGSALNDPKFMPKLTQVASNLKVNPDDLLKIMKFESKLDPKAHNAQRATGLIQFMPKTARSLGTTVEALYDMAPSDQLDYVEKYFKGLGTKPGYGVPEMYLLTFMPAALKLNKPDNYVLGRQNDNKPVFPELGRKSPILSKVWSQNPVFHNTTGQFTVGDVKRIIGNKR